MMLWNLQQFAGERTEKATPKKRQETRQKGQVIRSQELNSAIGMFLAMLTLKIVGSLLLGWISLWLSNDLSYVYKQDLSQFDVKTLFFNSLEQFGLAVSPIAGVLLISGLLISFIQVRALFTLQPLLPDLNRLNPITGLRRFFSLRSTVEVVKSILKITIICFVMYPTFVSISTQMNQWTSNSPEQMIVLISGITFDVGLKISLILLALAGFDYMYQRFEFEKSIKMSKQDIKDEYKNAEGNPIIKQKIRERQRMFAMQRMMADIPKADVVITNPTHFAVALQYISGTAAPKVVAKGVDLIAQKMKEIAREHDVTIVENRPLARSLYQSVEIGNEIPDELYQSVAEVLAYVYRIKQKK